MARLRIFGKCWQVAEKWKKFDDLWEMFWESVVGFESFRIFGCWKFESFRKYFYFKLLFKQMFFLFPDFVLGWRHRRPRRIPSRTRQRQRRRRKYFWQFKLTSRKPIGNQTVEVPFIVPRSDCFDWNRSPLIKSSLKLAILLVLFLLKKQSQGEQPEREWEREKARDRK